ncbi:MAG: HD domain-containing phosphohydrolase [Solirubrobacteraceae bacterium]
MRRLVRNHHERRDGRGYPHGLLAISLTCPTRVLSVCDVYDALISNRTSCDPARHRLPGDLSARSVRQRLGFWNKKVFERLDKAGWRY